MYRVLDNIKVIAVHPFWKTSNTSHKYANITLEMPWEQWEMIKKQFNLDHKGKPLPRKIKIGTASQLRWDQKNRKEKEK